MPPRFNFVLEAPLLPKNINFEPGSFALFIAKFGVEPKPPVLARVEVGGLGGSGGGVPLPPCFIGVE